MFDNSLIRCVPEVGPGGLEVRDVHLLARSVPKISTPEPRHQSLMGVGGPEPGHQSLMGDSGLLLRFEDSNSSHTLS